MSTEATHTFLDAIRHLPVGGALSIPDVPWADYEALLTELGDGYAVRVMYDRGRLEIVSQASGQPPSSTRICGKVASQTPALTCSTPHKSLDGTGST